MPPEGGGGRAPDVSSEIAYAAIEGEVATLPTVLGHHRDRRRRRLRHHLERGDRPVGESRRTPAPRARNPHPLRSLRAWGTHIRDTYEEPAQDFEMVYDTSRSGAFPIEREEWTVLIARWKKIVSDQS